MINSAVLTISISRKAGGLFISVRRLCQSLQEQGVGVTALACEDEYSLQDQPEWPPVETLLVRPLWPQWYGFSLTMAAMLRRIAPEITHIHGIWLYPSVANLLDVHRKRTPYLISPHGMLDPWAVRNSHWKKMIAGRLYENRHLRGAACLRSLCEEETRSIRHYGLNNPICQIPNGIDLPADNISAPPPWARHVDQERKVLLYLGRIHPKKNLSHLLKALAMMRRDGPRLLNDWVVAIAGWDQGGHEARLKKMTKDFDLTNNVIFLGPLFGEDKAAAYHHADAFIIPSFSEGLPMVILEAWAYQLPVLMTPECNLPEGFEKGAALGITTDPVGINKGLHELFELTDIQRKAIGQRGHELVAEKFTWPKVASDMKSVYEWILGGGSPPSCVTSS